MMNTPIEVLGETIRVTDAMRKTERLALPARRPERPAWRRLTWVSCDLE